MAKVRGFGAALAAALLCGTTACSSGDATPASDEDSSGAGAHGSGTTDSGAGSDTAPDESAGGGGTGGEAASDTAQGDPGGESGRSGAQAQEAVLANLPGRQDGGCVAVGDRRDVRADDIGAGPFDDARAEFRKQARAGQPATVRLYFIPASGGRELPGLTVTIRHLGSGEQQEVEETTTADADRWTFYDTEIPVPGDGTYEIRATSGSDSGCFRVRFGQRRE